MVSIIVSLSISIEPSDFAYLFLTPIITILDEQIDASMKSGHVITDIVRQLNKTHKDIEIYWEHER
jgi:hypothetical protein